MKLSGREKATIFLSILGPETSSQILRYLPGELADMIASGINNLPTPTPEALGLVLDDYKGFLALPPAGASARAKPMVEARVEMPPRENLPPKEVLLTAPPKRLAFVLAEESPQVIAYLLSGLPEDLAEEVIINLPPVREQVEIMLKTVKKSPLSTKLEAKLIKHFADKIWG